MKLCFPFIASSLAALLAGCGGGSGGGESPAGIAVPVPAQQALKAELGWDFTTPRALFAPVTIQPVYSGFEDHKPICTIVSGALPPGMTMTSDCVVSGAPAQAGTFSADVRVTATDVTGSIDATALIVVAKPGFGYRPVPFDGISAGVFSTTSPGFNNWGADASWAGNFSVIDGTLPPGMSIDAKTGIVSGTPTEPGNYRATVQATMTSPSGQSFTVSDWYMTTVQTARFIYTTPQYQFVGMKYLATTGYDASDSPLSNVRLAADPLPAGLVLDPVTGTITGIPTLPAGLVLGTKATWDRQIALRATWRSTFGGGEEAEVAGSLAISLQSPFTTYYAANLPFGGDWQIHQGVPAETRLQVSRETIFAPDVPDSVAIAIVSGTLPAGLTLDAATGTIGGTATEAGTFQVELVATVSLNGVTWMQSAGQLKIVSQ